MMSVEGHEVNLYQEEKRQALEHLRAQMQMKPAGQDQSS
jgi:hypothetical protein